MRVHVFQYQHSGILSTLFGRGMKYAVGLLSHRNTYFWGALHAFFTLLMYILMICVDRNDAAVEWMDLKDAVAVILHSLA